MPVGVGARLDPYTAARFKEEALPRPPKTIVLSPKMIGERLRAARVRREMSQGDLARALEVTQPNVSDIERGARLMTVQQLVKVCRVLQTTPDVILGETKQAHENGHIKDRRLLARVRKIDQLPKRDKQAIIRTIDQFLKGVAVS
jgi:transcriptional regulator with XRE-family HTH domain